MPRSRVSGLAYSSRQDADLPVEWQGRGDGEEVIIGVLDIDCEAVQGFDQDDVQGLEGIVRLISLACDW